MPERKAIGFHFVHMTANLAASGTLLPDLIPCKDEQEVEELARKAVQIASDREWLPCLAGEPLSNRADLRKVMRIG